MTIFKYRHIAKPWPSHATLFDIIHYEILYETMLAKENKSLWELITYCRVRLPYFCTGPIR